MTAEAELVDPLGGPVSQVRWDMEKRIWGHLALRPSSTSASCLFYIDGERRDFCEDPLVSECSEGLQRDFVLWGVFILVTIRFHRILAQVFIQQERQQLAMTAIPVWYGVGQSLRCLSQ